MTRVDAFSTLSADAIAALGNDVVPELLHIVERRAERDDLPFAKVARALPVGWRHVVLAARMIEDIDEAGTLAGAFQEIRSKRDILALEELFRTMGANQLSRALEDAREHTALLVDEDMDPFDIEELTEIPADSLHLSGVRAALTKRVRAMAASFP